MGHVLNNTIQDILARRARQLGKETLWLPGTDHAGIATQSRVEKELRKTGLTRHDLGRDKFVERTKIWRDEHGGIIFKQLQRLGASCDWDRNVHTLDADYSHAVLTAFVELFNRGYIYRGKRMVNWCPVSLTALSDEEVIMKPQKGILYKMRYEIVEHPSQYLEISTTRPETIMGDVAVAINPNDPRYKSFIGKHVWRPFPKQPIPIIADKDVDMDFGTGVLKVTPAHDPLDFAIGARHNLPIIDIMNPNGTLNALAGQDFIGIDRFEARKLAADKLREMGLLVAEQPYENNVGFSERADVPIEPRVSEQWFLKYPKIEEAKKVVRDGTIKFWPKRWEKTYLHWLDNIQDWCISRQLWWGHRIPVWYPKGSDHSDPSNWHVSVTPPPDLENWEQEEDVLDTWASSWLWPFATLGWPNEATMDKQGFYKFYPTTDLVTGPDIIFFWVARMIIAGLEFTGPQKDSLDDDDISNRIPFSNVYFTGIVRDIHGRKMSKSLGNSPDPIDLIDKYGADGLRFGIMSIAAQGQDVPFSEDRVQQGRNFANKLWNACRFRIISGNLSDNTSISAILRRMDPTAFDADDHAILGALIQLLDDVKKDLDLFEFNSAVQHLYSFFWANFCDWYVEVSKTKQEDGNRKTNRLEIQDLVIRQTLLLLHPFMPFITEELWHELAFGKENEFIQNINPGTGSDLVELLDVHGIFISNDAITEIANIRELVSKARALKAEFQLASRRDLTFYYTATEQEHVILQRHVDKIKSLLGAVVFEQRDNVENRLLSKPSILLSGQEKSCEEPECTQTYMRTPNNFLTPPESKRRRFQKESNMPAIVTPLGTLYLNIADVIDIPAERQRLSKEIVRLKKLIELGQSKLDNEAFVSKAPPPRYPRCKKTTRRMHSKTSRN